MEFLYDWPASRVEALYRVAKTMPFFKNPNDMIFLRGVVEYNQRKSNGPYTCTDT